MLARRSSLAAIQDFFFAEHSPYGLALVRMFLPAVAMAPMIRRFGRVRELYSADGAPQQLSELFGQGQVLPELPATFAAALYGLMIFAMCCAVFGLKTRISLIVMTVLYFYFNLLDGVSTMTKYSVIAAHIMVLLCLSECGAVWSVDAVLRRWREGTAATAVPARVPIWPARLIQMLFAFIYMGAAVTKIQTESFFSGEQMRYWMLSDWNWDNPVGEWMSQSTPLLLASGYITILWEVSFAFMAWRPVGRFFALGIGAVFHVMTCLTLGLYIFPLVCFAGYFAFLTERDIVIIRRFVHRLRVPTALLGVPRFAVARVAEMRPASVPLSLAWLSLAMLTAIASAEVDHQFDLYGMRRNNGPMPLPTLDRDVALAMIENPRPLREKDKYFSFDIGTALVGGQLANRTKSFEYSDVIIAQCNLNPPHEDLWVECILEDADGRIIDNSGQYVTRDMKFANFRYAAGNSLVPGDYNMVLKSSGIEVARRPFTLNGDPEALPEMQSQMTN